MLDADPNDDYVCNSNVIVSGAGTLQGSTYAWQKPGTGPHELTKSQEGTYEAAEPLVISGIYDPVLSFNLQTTCWEHESTPRASLNDSDKGAAGISNILSFMPLTGSNAVIPPNVATEFTTTVPGVNGTNSFEVVYDITWSTTRLATIGRDLGGSLEMCDNEPYKILYTSEEEEESIHESLRPYYRWEVLENGITYTYNRGAIFNVNGSERDGDGYKGYEFNLDGHLEAVQAAVGTRTLSIRVALMSEYWNNVMVSESYSQWSIARVSPAPEADSEAIVAEPFQCNESPGTIRINNVSGGTGTYSVSIKQLATGAIYTDGEFEVSELPYRITGNHIFGDSQSIIPGQYQVNVMDMSPAGCAAANSSTIIVTVPPRPSQVDWGGQIENQSCAGTSTGRIILGGAGGTPDSNLPANGYTFYYQGQPVVGELTGLLPGGYTIQIRDSNYSDDEPSWCERTRTLTVLQATPINTANINVQVTDVSCQENNDGSITLSNVTGGTPPYQFQLRNGSNVIRNWQSGNSFINLPYGTGQYTVDIRDNKTCEVSKEVTIMAPDPLGAAISDKIDVSCHGGSNGGFKITGTGRSTNQYLFSLDGGSYGTLLRAEETYTNLSAGIHHITIKDVNGCISDAIDVEIDEPAPVSAAVTTLPVSCSPRSDGSVTIVLTGGTQPYYYQDQQSGLPIEITPNASGEHEYQLIELPSGNYAIYVKDANNCTNAQQDPWLEITAEVQELNPLEAYVNSGDVASPTCAGDNDSRVTIRAQGGSPGYWFSTDGQNYQQLNDPDTNLPLAAYTYEGLTVGVAHMFYIKDVRNCEATKEITINPTPSLSIQVLELSDVDCKGNNNGSVKVQGAGGMSGYEYSLTENSGFGSSDTFSALSPGMYTFWVKDINGCRATIEREIQEPDEILQLHQTIEMVTCKGYGNGKITLHATGGNSSYLYSIDDVVYNEASSFESLQTGTYNFYVKDDKGCSASVLNTQIEEPQSPLTISVLESDIVKCHDGSDAFFEIKAEGGWNSYFMSVNGGSFQPTLRQTGLQAGIYNIIIKDNGNCSLSMPVDLSHNPDPITITKTITNASCGGEDGMAEVTAVTNAEAPHSIRWFNESGNQIKVGSILDAASAGQYSVEVLDNKGCRLLEEVPISGGNLQWELTNITSTSCSNTTDGSASLTISGSASSQYQVTLPNNEVSLINGDQTLTWNSYTKGNNTVRISDGNCLTFAVVNIPGPDPVQVDITGIQKPLCFGTPTGSFSVMAQGGNNNYTYKLYQNNTIMMENTTGVFTALQANSYSVVATDRKGCEASAFISIDEEKLPLQLRISSIVNTSCLSATDGEINFEVSGGIQPYTSILFDVAHQELERAASYEFTNLLAGDYFINITDSDQCGLAAPQPVKVNIKPSPVINVVSDNISCPGQCDGTITIASLENSSQYGFKLDDEENTTGIFEGLCAGSYSITITHNTSGCAYQQNVHLSEPVMELELGEPAIICQGQTVTLSPVLQGEYAWSSANGFSSTSQQVVLGESGLYQLSVTTPIGCVVTDEFILTTSTDLLEADLLMGSEAIAGDILIALDLTNPIPEVMEWEFDQDHIDHLINESPYHQFRFNDPGVYQMELHVRLGECQDVYVHEVEVRDRSEDNDDDSDSERLGSSLPLIKEFTAYPNPVSGSFKVNIVLNKEEAISITLIHHLTARAVFSSTVQGQVYHEIDVNTETFSPGIYHLKLNTASGETRVFHIVIL